MIDLQLDLREFERAARNAAQAIDQVPFALSKSLNEAVLKTEDRLATETWPRSVTVRNPRYLKAALRPEFANKRTLTVALVDKLGHVDLRRLEKGGTKRATKGGNLAVPTSRVGRGAGGAVRRGQKPRALARAVVKKGLIFQRQGSGKNARLVLMYKLQPSARIKAEVPFHADFARYMREGVRRSFGPAMQKAMSTRR